MKDSEQLTEVVNNVWEQVLENVGTMVEIPPEWVNVLKTVFDLGFTMGYESGYWEGWRDSMNEAED